MFLICRIVFLWFFAFTVLIAQSVAKVPDKWLTHFEKSGFLRTPLYKETVKWFDAVPGIQKIEFGKTPQGRTMTAYLIQKDKKKISANINARKKPLLFITAGIHSGEIEGKDAGMILFREILITREKYHLLETADILFVPVFNIDGHERFGKFNRINQNGPEEMGWRTTAQNLNLNRDWMKADAPEMQALLQLIVQFAPDFYIDSHTTDGADFQYSINYGLDYGPNFDRELAKRVSVSFIPYLEERINTKGFLIAPYLDFRGETPTKGLTGWITPPRFSTGYAVTRNRISLLIETHMLKPYKERVFATKAMFETALEYLQGNGKKLLLDNIAADNRAVQAFSQKKYFPINFVVTDSQVPFLYKGIRFKKDSSFISGTQRITYTGEPYEVFVPYFSNNKASDSVSVPFAYAFPPEWSILTERLKVHGVAMKTLSNTQSVTATEYVFKDVKFNKSPYEGRLPVTVAVESVKNNFLLPPGTVIVSTEQPLMRLIMYACEPYSGDSFLRWGFMNGIFEQKEYFEHYVMEKIAEQMLNDSPQLREEFEKKLTEDESFRKSPDKRLNFFYLKSPYSDKKINVYPILRIEEKF